MAGKKILSYRDLEIWQMARELVVPVHKMTLSFSEERSTIFAKVSLSVMHCTTTPSNTKMHKLKTIPKLAANPPNWKATSNE